MSHPPADRVPRSRIAGAPISWGVCEVPGWGHQLRPERVLAEMRQLGLAATEFGPDDFLPAEPAVRAAALEHYGLTAVGGFVPVVLHDPARDPFPTVLRSLATLRASDARTLVLAADTGQVGYDSRPELDRAGWKWLLDNLDRIADTVAEVGVTAVLHPHVGTMVERADEVDRVLADSRIGLCLDTGHLVIGGTDPHQLVRQAAERIAHVHLKDVDAASAEQVRAGHTSYTRAVAAGMYRPLGTGHVEVAAIVAALEAADYQGWYVLEQDTVLATEPLPDSGPLRDVAASLSFLEGVSWSST